MKAYYKLTFSPGSHNIYAISGKFSDDEGAKDQVVIGHGEIVSLILPDTSGKNCELATINVATSIRSLAGLHTSDGNHILVGLDTGGFISLKYSPSRKLEINAREHFDSPVQFLQFLEADGQGLVFMIVRRKQKKIFYISRKDGSPQDRIEVQDSNTITYSVAALGREDGKNLCFAAIELDDYNAQTHIVYYEVRFEGNFSIERSTVPVDSGASLLLAVPGGADGPGGILVCTKKMVIYKKRDRPDVFKAFPGKEEGTLIVSATTCRRHHKYGLFYLFQTEFGSIFKLSLILEDSGVTGFDIEHFDDIPVTYAMCLLDSGILFAASRTGKHALYQLPSTDEEERGELSSLKSLSRIDPRVSILEMGVTQLHEEKVPHVFSVCPREVCSIIRGQSKGKTTDSGQLHSKGIWYTTNEQGTILKCASNSFNKLELVSAIGRELLYCIKGSPNRSHRMRMPAEVTCLCVPQIPDAEGKDRSFCLAVGLIDQTIRILVLHPRNPSESLWDEVSCLNMLSPPEWLSFLSPDNVPYQFLIASLKDGLLITMMMLSSGALSVLSSHCLGSTPPKLILSNSSKNILCISDQTWVGHTLGERLLLTPMRCDARGYVASICCLCTRGVVAAARDRTQFSIVKFLSKNTTFTMDFIPHNFVLQEFIICLSSERAFSLDGIPDLIGSIGKVNRHVSCITVINPMSGETLSKLKLHENEVAHSLCTLKFNCIWTYKTLLILGIGFHESPASGSIRIFEVMEEGKSLKQLGNTYVEGVPQALCPFKGALLAGFGPVLRMYEQRNLVELHLRCEIKIFSDANAIVSIYVVGERIYVVDSQEVVHCFKYRTSENQLHVFQYGNVPHSVTAFLEIDSNTMAWSDKFGNVFFVQFPSKSSEEVSDNPRSSKRQKVQPSGSLDGVEEMCFHVGDVVTCLQKASLVPGDDECILYGTVTGTFGAFLPLALEDVELLSGLERQMRREYPPLCNRSHRNNENPQSCVIDGDICETFQTIGSDSQKSISGKLGTTVIKILHKLGATRNKIIGRELRNVCEIEKS